MEGVISWMFGTLLAVPARADTWLLTEHVVVEVKPPVPVGWVDSRSVVEWVVDWTPGEPTLTAYLCAIRVEPVMSTVTSWSERAIAAVPPLTRPVAYDGVSFVVGPVTETIGGGDDDGDGNPGITLRVTHPRIGGGDVWIRQTAKAAWTGELRNDGTFAGTMTYEPDQALLGATTWWLRMGLAQRAHRTEVSTFELAPLELDGVASRAACPAS